MSLSGGEHHQPAGDAPGEPARSRVAPADPEEFAAALTPLIPRAMRLARALGCSPEDAADAVQEASASAWRHRAQCRSDFDSWFLTIVRRSARSLPRRWLTAPAGWRPEAATWDAQPGEDMPAELGLLPPRQRAAVWLRYGLDMATSDVGSILGISDAATKQLLLRARQALRHALAPALEERP